MSQRKRNNLITARTGTLLIAGLTATAMAIVPATAGLAARSTVRAAGTALSVVAVSTNKATDEDKVKAAGVLGINPGMDMLVLNDQQFVLELWRRAKEDTYVKAEALRAYDTNDADAAYKYITAGIFAAADDDARVEIAAEQAKALRRSVAVTVNLDPKVAAALVERNDRDFIIGVFQHATAGTHLYAAAKDAFRDGSTQQDWTQFLTTGAKAAVAQDLADEIAKADAEQAAKLRAEQLSTAKRSLLQLLLLPVTDELVNAPNRQFVLHILHEAKGGEVQLAAQAAVNAPDAELDKALTDFIFTGGAAANTRDENAAAAKELADLRARVTAIRDVARRDGQQANLLNAADKALSDGSAVVLRAFLLKGQDEARALDKNFSEHSVNIMIAESSKMCLAMAGSSTAPGAHAVQWACSGAADQDWRINARSGGRYEIKNDHSDMCLAIAGGSKDNGAHLVQWHCNNGNEDQYWQLSKDANGYTELHNMLSDKCLAIEGNSTSNGAHILQWPCKDGNLDQNWQIKPRTVGQQVRNEFSGLCLSNGGTKDRGAHAIQTACNGANDAEWHLIKGANGHTQIRNDRSSMCLAIDGGSMNNGAHALQWDCSGAADHDWDLTTDGNGVTHIRNAKSGQCLAIAGGTKADGAHLLQWPCSSNADQNWRLTEN
ncbi:RICIN domain-containing protein [Krasilnikovia sp. MM14-A1259]|uniref:RICIN domain-containing protein n=1 Tax=Krasilnikovia sp. MM14-A1259 TaxID=3373539 RepID=UPI0037FEF5E7